MADAWSVILGAAAAIVGAVVGGLLSGPFSRYLDERFLGPRLKIDFKNGEEFKTEANLIVRGGQSYKEIFIRARVRNESIQLAKNCTAWLVRVKKVHHAGTESTKYFDSRQIPWANNDFRPHDIPKDTEHYVDVVSVFTNVEGWNFKAMLFSSEEDLCRYKGTLRFTILVTGDGAKADHCQIDVTYTGDRHQFAAVPVRSTPLAAPQQRE